MEFDAVFISCFTQHLSEREPQCKSLSSQEISKLIMEYNRFLQLKYYIFVQRNKFTNTLSNEELESTYPEYIEIPLYLMICWERHMLWTKIYRDFCINILGVFIEQILFEYTTEVSNLKKKGYAQLLSLYEKAFGATADETFWPPSFNDSKLFSKLEIVYRNDMYPVYTELLANNNQDSDKNAAIISLANSKGFDKIEPFATYQWDPQFYENFRIFICNKEPSIRSLSEMEYNELVLEYIKFMIIMKTVVIGRDNDHPAHLSKEAIDYLYPDNVAPSNIVDLIWHGHILCTSNYREYCSTKFGRFMDHHPTIKNTKFDRNDNQGYMNTLRVYEELFGYVPSYKWWPRPFNGQYALQPSFKCNIRQGILTANIRFDPNEGEDEVGEDKKSNGYTGYSSVTDKCFKFCWIM